jgi:hypothetical protein
MTFVPPVWRSTDLLRLALTLLRERLDASSV